MLKQDMQKKRARVLQDSTQVKEHYKMYKVGKTWLFAGLFTVSLGAGLAFGGHQDVYADTATPTEPATAQVTPQQTDSQAKSVVIGNNAQSQDTASNMKADTNSDTDSETNTNADTVATAATTATENQATEQKTPATADTQAKSTDVQTTNLGDVTDQSTIDQAKTAANAAYAKTGTPQTITAVAGAEEDPATTADPVQAVSAKVEDATKTYDNKSDTPATFNVQLSDNLTAPTGWFVTGNKDEYQVAAASGDIDLSKINQNVGTYDVTLSATGLARLNAVQANQKKNLALTTADVTAGKLTISKAPVVTGSVAIENTSKLYDNDATTDPTSFKVKVNPGLKAPTDWTANADGSYTVALASGDIQANVDSQEPGTYTINLSASGLQRLNAVNPNYDVKANNIIAGNFVIQSNTKLSIGVGRIATSQPTLPSSLPVNVSREVTVPSDWHVSYDNTAQDEVVYDVPVSYFDTSAVQPNTIGTYSVNLTNTALTNLNTANPNHQILPINVHTGTIIVANTAGLPGRTLANFGGGGGTLANAVLNDGDGATLKLGFFSGTGAVFQNFTDLVIIPAGLAVANVTTDPGNPTKITSYTKSNNPVQSIIDSVKPVLDANNIPYSDFTVKQLPDYKGRQTFAVQWGSVDTSVKNGATYPINVVVDPDINNVSEGNFGNRVVANDAAILYATDDNTLTGGKYIINSQGAYPNVPMVANAIGVTNAETIGQGYDNVNWAGTYTIKHVPVQDTYNLKDAAGNKIADAVTTSGMVGDAYDPLSIVPDKITTSDGTEYILNQTTVPTEQTFKQATKPIAADATLATGATYTATYKKVIDTTKASNQAKVNDSQMTWKSAVPATMTVTLPSNLKAPSTWTKTTGNTYSINTADGDLDLSNVKSPIGSYDVLLSKQGLTALAAANPDYLFDNLATGVGKLKVVSLNIPVTVKDTAGTSLKTVPDIQLGSDANVNGANAGVTGYPTSQLKSVTFNYAENDNNTTGVKTATLVANKTTGTITVTTTYYGNKPQSVVTMTKEELGGVDAGAALALQLNDGSMGSGVGFNDPTPQITPAQAGTMAALTGINVVYNQKVTATIVPSDGNGNPISNTTPTTITGFPGDAVSVPEVPGYTPESNVTIPNGPDYTLKVTYTPNTQTVKVQFEDQAGNKLGDAVEWTGATDSNIDYTQALNTQKTLISQGYLPINGDKTGFATAPKTFDRDDKTTQTITVTLSKFNNQVPADAILVPVDPEGNPIKNTTSTTVTGLPGTTVNAPEVPGYTVIDTDKTVNIPTPVPNKDNVTNGKATTPDKRGATVKITYIANNQTVNVQFVDQDGNKLGDVTALTGGSDSNINYTPALNAQKTLISQGYLPINGDKTGFAIAPKVFDHDDKNTPTVTVKLTKITPISADTTLVPVDKDGNPIKGTTPTVITDVPGKTVTVPTIPGYTPKNGNSITIPTPEPNNDNVTDGKVNTPDRGNKINIEYVPDTQSIQVQFVDQDGHKLGDATTLTGASDSNVDLTPAFRTEQSIISLGYTPAKGNQNGLDSITKAFTDYGKVPVYTVVLNKISDTDASLTLVPSDADGNPIPNTTPTTVTGVPGKTVTVPAVPGYTATSTTVTIPTPVPNKDNVTNGKVNTGGNHGTTQKITYTPDTQKLIVKVGDKTLDLSGGSDSAITYDENAILNLIPAGYTLGGDKLGTTSDFAHFLTANSAPAKFDHDDTKDQTWTVPIAEKVDFETATTTRTIHFVGGNGETVAPDQVQTVTYTRPVGAATGTPLGSYTPLGWYAEYTSPTVSGYTVKTGEGIVPAKDPMIAEKPINTVITVHYVGTNQSATVKYVDDDNNGAVIDTPATTLTGVTGGSATWNTNNKPAGYDLADGQAASGSYTFTAIDNAGVTIHLTHHINTETITATRTINFKGNTDVDESKLPSTIVQKVNWTISTDEATGEVTFTPDANSNYQAVPLHSIPSDNAEITYVPEFTYVTAWNPVKFTATKDELNTLGNPDLGKNTTFLNADETYYYNAIGIPETGAQGQFKGQVPTDNVPSAQQYTINFVTPNGDVIGHMPFVGNPGNKVNVSTNIPKGYVLTPGNDGVVTVPDKQDPKTPIIFNVTTPAGKDADGVQVWTKDQVPDDAPYANQYTVNFVTPNGDIIGHTTLVGNPGNNFNVTPNIPKGYVPTPGKDGNITIADTDVPGKPIVFNVTTPAGQDADGVQVWTKDQVPDAPYANQYTVNFVTSGGSVVGTATLIGNPGNNFNVTGKVPNGYTLVDGTNGVVEISKDQNPAQPISIKVTVPGGSSNNGGTPPTDNGTGVPGGTSTDTGTGLPAGNPSTTTDGPGSNTEVVDQPDNNTVTNDNTDNNPTSTDKSNSTVGKSANSNGTNSGTQTGLVQQSSNAEAGQAQQVANTNEVNSTNAKNKAATLPQTNEQQNTSVWAMIGLSLMSMLSMLGITKKKREDEK
ncbi:MBG domain-containing protein [Secundilactobacillus yichangensis]|uniref:MBG domain-containing protein n=1 Tax=Secundilactobacillus yichangensis TaxID=2799580 RepID=UPI001940AB83|nr:MBG domain-containing protein [Secundilactobacillus yichangensis]